MGACDSYGGFIWYIGICGVYKLGMLWSCTKSVLICSSRLLIFFFRLLFSFSSYSVFSFSFSRAFLISGSVAV